MPDFRVELESYRGPLDLLLYLVRKHEVEITEIPLAKVTEQFCQTIEVLKELDVNWVGDFLEIASLLIEIKSKRLLPEDVTEESAEMAMDPREDLVQRLLEYKKFKDAACMLEDRSRQWRQRYVRVANDLPPRKVDPSEQVIREAELWDLVSAFGRQLRNLTPAPESNIVYDGTPIHAYMNRIHEKLKTVGEASFSDLFDPGMHKSALIGVFLAILELVRHHNIEATQDESTGDIRLTPGSQFTEEVAFDAADSYDS
jgi:segregation and condensation protein A